jgi:hypothetical protein
MLLVRPRTSGSFGFRLATNINGEHFGLKSDPEHDAHGPVAGGDAAILVDHEYGSVGVWQLGKRRADFVISVEDRADGALCFLHCQLAGQIASSPLGQSSPADNNVKEHTAGSVGESEDRSITLSCCA